MADVDNRPVRYIAVKTNMFGEFFFAVQDRKREQIYRSGEYARKYGAISAARREHEGRSKFRYILEYTDERSGAPEDRDLDLMTVWSAACEVLDGVESISFYHGHIHPEDAGHLASQIAAKCEMYVDIGEFGGMTMTIGNTLIEHRTVDRVWGPNLTWRQKLQRWRKRSVCSCGYVCDPGQMFEYHQAMAINKAVVEYHKELEDRRVNAT